MISIVKANFLIWKILLFGNQNHESSQVLTFVTQVFIVGYSLLLEVISRSQLCFQVTTLHPSDSFVSRSQLCFQVTALFPVHNFVSRSQLCFQVTTFFPGHRFHNVRGFHIVTSEEGCSKTDMKVTEMSVCVLFWLVLTLVSCIILMVWNVICVKVATKSLFQIH